MLAKGADPPATPAAGSVRCSPSRWPCSPRTSSRKTIVVATLSDRPPVQLLGGFLKLTVSRNPGAAFSIGPSVTVVFTAIAVGVIVFILRASRRIRVAGLGGLARPAAGRCDRQPDRPAAALSRPIPRLRGRLDLAPALAGVQPGRLIDRVRRQCWPCCSRCAASTSTAPEPPAGSRHDGPRLSDVCRCRTGLTASVSTPRWPGCSACPGPGQPS